MNASSMADIAFLLLIFFLVTTTIASDKGLPMLLPPYNEDVPPELKKAEHNVFAVLINSRNELLVEKEPMELSAIREAAKVFLSNNGANEELSDNPQEAVVSLKGDRGTSYSTYLTVLDELTAAYNELRAEYLGITVEQYLSLDKSDPEQERAYKAARAAYPYQLSEAEPTDIGGN